MQRHDGHCPVCQEEGARPREEGAPGSLHFRPGDALLTPRSTGQGFEVLWLQNALLNFVASLLLELCLRRGVPSKGALKQGRGTS